MLFILHELVFWAVLEELSCFGRQFASFLDKPIKLRAKKGTFAGVIYASKKFSAVSWMSRSQYKKKVLRFFCFEDGRWWWLKFYSNEKVAILWTFLLVSLSFLCWVHKMKMLFLFLFLFCLHCSLLLQTNLFVTERCIFDVPDLQTSTKCKFWLKNRLAQNVY